MQQTALTSPEVPPDGRLARCVWGVRRELSFEEESEPCLSVLGVLAVLLMTRRVRRVPWARIRLRLDFDKRIRDTYPSPSSTPLPLSRESRSTSP